jgi:hypothetical protein
LTESAIVRHATPDHNVELEVLHRRIEDLFDRSSQTMNLIDEEHIALTEIANDCSKIACSFYRRN